MYVQNLDCYNCQFKCIYEDMVYSVQILFDAQMDNSLSCYISNLNHKWHVLDLCVIRLLPKNVSTETTRFT